MVRRWFYLLQATYGTRTHEPLRDLITNQGQLPLCEGSEIIWAVWESNPQANVSKTLRYASSLQLPNIFLLWFGVSE